MKIETIDIDGLYKVSFCEIPGMVDYSDSACLGLRYLTANVRSENRRREVFTSNLLIRELFGDACRLNHKQSGAPFLENCKGRTPEISMSHCRDLVAIAYGKSPVGVDVETIAERVMHVRERVQSDEEQRFTGHSLVANSIAWTAKEALFKVIPEEGVDFAADLQVDLSKVSPQSPVNEYTAVAFGRTYRLVSKVLDDRILTIAYQISK